MHNRGTEVCSLNLLGHSSIILLQCVPLLEAVSTQTYSEPSRRAAMQAGPLQRALPSVDMLSCLLPGLFAVHVRHKTYTSNVMDESRQTKIAEHFGYMKARKDYRHELHDLFNKWRADMKARELEEQAKERQQRLDEARQEAARMQALLNEKRMASLAEELKKAELQHKLVGCATGSSSGGGPSRMHKGVEPLLGTVLISMLPEWLCRPRCSFSARSGEASCCRSGSRRGQSGGLHGVAGAWGLTGERRVKSMSPSGSTRTIPMRAGLAHNP